MKKLLFAGITKVYKTPSEQMLLEKWGWQIWSRGFPSGSVCKEPTCNAGDPRDMGSIPGLGRSLGGGHSNLLRYFGLKNPLDRGAWRATVHRVTKSRKWPKQMNTNAGMHIPWYQNPQMFNFLILNGVVIAYNINTSSCIL